MAGLDTTIALGIKPVDFGDPNEGRMNALRAQMMQMQMQQGQFNMMKAQRDMQYQDQQRAQAAAAAARDKAAEAQAIKLYGQTGAPGYQAYSPSMEPGAASDVGMLGGGQGYTEGAVNRLAMPAQPKNFDDAITTALQSGKIDPTVVRKLMALKEAQNVYAKSNLGVDEATAKTKEAGYKASDAEIGNFDKNYDVFRKQAMNIASPQEAAAWTSAMYDNPVLGKMMTQMGMSKEQAVAKAAQEYATDPQKWVAAHMNLKAEDAYKAVYGGGDDTKGIPITNDRGDVIIVNPKTGQQIGTTLTGAGKQGGTFAKAQASRANAIRDMDAAIPELKALIEPNSILDKSTASGAGALADSTMAFFGKSTEGAQAAAALKPIADRFLKMVPRFEGPQSDKDVVSYKSAAADLANEKLPVATRRAAAKTLLRLTEARRGQFGYSDEEAVPELYSPNQSGSGQAPQSGPYAPGTRAPAGGNPYASKSDAEIKAALGIKD